LTDSDDFAKRLSEAFKEEASEILADVRRLFGQLDSNQQNHSDTAFGEQLPQIDQALARLHSLKGSARAVSELQAVTICQWLETTLANAKAEEKSLDRVLIHALSFSIELLDELLGLEEFDEHGKNRIKAEIGKLLGFAAQSQTDAQSEIQTQALTDSEAIEQKEKSSIAPEQQLKGSVKAPSLINIDNLTAVRVPIEKLDR